MALRPPDVNDQVFPFDPAVVAHALTEGFKIWRSSDLDRIQITDSSHPLLPAHQIRAPAEQRHANRGGTNYGCLAQQRAATHRREGLACVRMKTLWTPPPRCAFGNMNVQQSAAIHHRPAPIRQHDIRVTRIQGASDAKNCVFLDPGTLGPEEVPTRHQMQRSAYAPIQAQVMPVSMYFYGLSTVGRQLLTRGARKAPSSARGRESETD